MKTGVRANEFSLHTKIVAVGINTYTSEDFNGRQLVGPRLNVERFVAAAQNEDGCAVPREQIAAIPESGASKAFILATL